MILYWKKDSPEAWEHFRKAGTLDFETGEATYPESDAFMKNFREIHIPILEETLIQWDKEADICGSVYGALLRDDIKWARKCNARQDEVLVFNQSKGGE